MMTNMKNKTDCEGQNRKMHHSFNKSESSGSVNEKSLVKKQLHARLPSMISFCSHGGVCELQVSEKDEGGGRGVRLRIRDEVRLRRNLDGFKFKTVCRVLV